MSAIRKQFRGVETDVWRIGWIFGQVWEEIHIKQVEEEDTEPIAKEAEKRIRTVAEHQITRKKALFVWYKPWEKETRDEYWEQEDKRDEIEYEHGLAILGYPIVRGRS